MEISTHVGLPVERVENLKVDFVEEGKRISEFSIGSVDDAGTDLADEAVKVEISSEAIDLLRVKKMAAPALDEIENSKITRFPKLIDSGNYGVAGESTIGPAASGNFRRVV